MNTYIIFWISSIGSLTVELTALEHLNGPHRFITGSQVSDHYHLGYLFTFLFCYRRSTNMTIAMIGDRGVMKIRDKLSV